MVDLGSRFCLGPISIMFDDFRHVVASDILLSLCPDIQCPIPLKMELRWSMLIQSLGMWSEAILDQRVVVRNSTTLQCYSPTKSESIRIDQNRFEFSDARHCRPLPAGLIYIQRQGHELVAMLPGSQVGVWAKLANWTCQSESTRAAKLQFESHVRKAQQTLHCFCCSGTLPQCSCASAVPTSSPSHFSAPALA